MQSVYLGFSISANTSHQNVTAIFCRSVIVLIICDQFISSVSLHLSCWFVSAYVVRYLIKFLLKLTKYSEVNKMTPTNVSLVIGPNLLWPAADAG